MPIFALLFVMTALEDNPLQVKKGWTVSLDEFEVYRSRALAASPNDVVAVIDRDAGRVVLFDATGTMRGELGRSGQGPGELERPVEVTWGRAEGVFVVLDMGNNRISKWREDGSLVSETQVSQAGLSPRLLGAGTLFFVNNAFHMNNPPTLFRLDMGSGDAKSFFVYNKSKPIQFNDGDGVRVMFRWNNKLSYDLGSDFLVYNWGERPMLYLLDLDGKATGKPIPTGLPRPELSDGQLEEGINLMPHSMHGGIRQVMIRPDHWPYVREVYVDPADRIWVVGATGAVEDPHPFGVFQRDGKRLGRGLIPKVPNFIAADGQVYYLEDIEGEDPDDLILSVTKKVVQLPG